ncbi:MAG: rhodanese-like domain-containing protein [Myxococcota bacterium]
MRNLHLHTKLPIELAGGLTRPTLLDVRTREEFGAGHVEGAVNVPIDELERRLSELGSPEHPIAVYCRSGRRSARAVSLLRAAGFETVTDLGGLAQ